MSVTLDLNLIMNKLVKELGSKIYFVIITSLHGVVMKSYINEEEFNKESISLNISQLYESAVEVTGEIGIHEPDFNIIHSDNFYVLSIKILERIIILLTEDQIDVKQVFEIINQCASPS
ncbi:MAG: hypothetical protein ACFFDO_06385 [Candidatus Thorarchaeota archaeon]